MLPNHAVLIIACGALAHEIVALKKLNQWTHVTIDCLPAELHNRPEKIPAAVEEKLRAKTHEFDKVFIAYGDCGTGGQLDKVLAQHHVERLPGVHCYEFFAGSAVFTKLANAEIGTFYLTDFLAQHFDRIVVRGFGLDRHPDLQEMLFGHYKKLIYLSQTHNPILIEKAQQAAQRLDLEFEHRHSGYGDLEVSLKAAIA